MLNFLALRETWWVCFLQSEAHMEKSQNNKFFKNGCKKNERSSTSLFSTLNVCGLEISQKKPTKLLLAPKEA
jgi:hypothetical protein